MIWCVEDDNGILDTELYALTSTGFAARGFADGDAFWAALQQERPRLVLLDVMLPGADGVTLLRRMKERPDFRDIPVIMATAKGTEYDKVIGLDLGADDYLAKPFGMLEMVSRVKAVLRRSRPREAESILRAGALELNQREHTVSVNGERIMLTLKEYELLKMFLDNPGRVFTRDQLLEQVWGTSYAGETRTVDVHIGTLRSKLGVCGNAIETVRGVGYRYSSC